MEGIKKKTINVGSLFTKLYAMWAYFLADPCTILNSVNRGPNKGFCHTQKC